MEQRFSDNDVSRRDIPSFIEPRPPLISNPFMRPRPQKATNLLQTFEEDLELEEPDLVQVYLRMKPYDGSSNLYEVRNNRSLVTSVDTTTAGHGRRTQHNVSRMYEFSRIFDAKCSQKEIFDEVVKDNLKKLVEGNSFTLLTYGASGSGKTYTLMGSVSAPGLVPRSLEYVFKLVDAAQIPFYKPSDSGAVLLAASQQEFELQWVKKLRQVTAPARDKYRRMSTQLHSDLTVSNINLANRSKYYVWVSFIEIYNEAIYDLLAPPDKRVKLRMREDSSGEVYVKGAIQAFVRSGVEAYDVMVAGKHNLVVAATGVHAHSSRSHCIFTITMLTETDGETRTSCVRLCDLAGCERARATRNTGARMQESRAINSSLHVLERCLHMLRSKQKQGQEGFVPYRESKLTRLLGSGLSGSRGEAVSMVVTLNPAPQYAQETKHVLSLAAVAKNLQINNTAMFASTLESSAQDTSTDSTIYSSTEVRRLKTKVELLSFELAQAESRNKELQLMMEERRRTVADTMREMVEEAKDISREYYESRLAALRNENEELEEEYQAKLAKIENKLWEESEARARAEEEVKHLLACLHERDEKTCKDPETPTANVDEIVLTDSEDDENDPLNESLEPSFKKECINRSLSQAVTIADYIHKPSDVDESASDESSDTITQDTSKNSVKAVDTDGNRSSDTRISDFQQDNGPNESIEIRNQVRGTYFVRKSTVDMSDDDKDDSDTGTKDFEVDPPREAYFTRTSTIDTSIDEEIQEMVEEKTTANEMATEKLPNDILPPTKVSETLVSKILQSLKKSTNINASDNSLRQFEQLEKASQEYKDETVGQDTFGDIKMFTEKRTFFDAVNLQVSEKPDETEMMISCNKTKKAVNLHVSEKPDETEMMISCSKTKNAVNLHVSEKPDETEMMISCNKTKDAFGETLDMEKATISVKSHKKEDVVKNVEKKETNEVSLITMPVLNKRSYFDNIEEKTTAPNKMVAEIISSARKNYDRSPSIVSGDSDPCEPSTMKKLLGEKIAKLEVLTSINKSAKKHESIDVFEGFESPQVKSKEKTPTPVKFNIENVRKSLDELVISQKSSNKHEMKSVDVTEQENIQNFPKITVTPAKVSEIHKQDNTIEEFENIYKDLSTHRPTEFDQLAITQEIDANIKDSNIAEDIFAKSESDKENMHSKVNAQQPAIGLKYNLRHKNKSILNTDDKKVKIEEVLSQNTEKCERKTIKRSLRLRRPKNEDENGFEEKWDIMNLKKEFSDVTLGLPAEKKVVEDIPSPEKSPGEENPPIMGIQSCPSKSVQRSRRKLFTPRVDPLEESTSQAGDSSERVRVPRPSYHRARARRKL